MSNEPHVHDVEARRGRPDDGPSDEHATAPVAQAGRTSADIVMGVLLIAGGVVVLGDVAVATVVSVFLLGWMAVVSGAVLLAAALSRMKSGGFWSTALGGMGLLVLGIFMLRNPLVGALSFALLAGSSFLTTGLVRLFASGHFGRDRWLVVISGLVSVGLGLFVLFNVVNATMTLVGVLLGVATLVEGITLLVVGRVRYVRPSLPV